MTRQVFDQFPADSQPTFFYIREWNGRRRGVVAMRLVRTADDPEASGHEFDVAISLCHPNDRWDRDLGLIKVMGRLVATARKVGEPAPNFRVIVDPDDEPSLSIEDILVDRLQGYQDIDMDFLFETFDRQIKSMIKMAQRPRKRRATKKHTHA